MGGLLLDLLLLRHWSHFLENNNPSIESKVTWYSISNSYNIFLPRNILRFYKYSKIECLQLLYTFLHNLILSSSFFFWFWFFPHSFFLVLAYLPTLEIHWLIHSLYWILTWPLSLLHNLPSSPTYLNNLNNLNTLDNLNSQNHQQPQRTQPQHPQQPQRSERSERSERSQQSQQPQPEPSFLPSFLPSDKNIFYNSFRL